MEDEKCPTKGLHTLRVLQTDSSTSTGEPSQQRTTSRKREDEHRTLGVVYATSSRRLPLVQRSSCSHPEDVGSPQCKEEPMFWRRPSPLERLSSTNLGRHQYEDQRSRRSEEDLHTSCGWPSHYTRTTSGRK